MCALLLELKDGDEVIVPSFTFVSSINAFVLRGAKPVFADVRPDTLNLDESRLEALITPKTCAIVVVHYAGVACEMDTIMEIANRRNIPVIEDNAHGLFGKYKGKYLGTFGVMATQSFHETKNFTSGEGGALLINDPKYIDNLPDEVRTYPAYEQNPINIANNFGGEMLGYIQITDTTFTPDSTSRRASRKLSPYSLRP